MSADRRMGGLAPKSEIQGLSLGGEVHVLRSVDASAAERTRCWRGSTRVKQTWDLAAGSSGFPSCSGLPPIR